jgi:hypothetical protein
LLACNNDKAIPLRTDLLGSDDRGKILQATKPAIMDSTAGKVLNTQLSGYLLLGKMKNVECRILLRFDPLPDSGEVVSAKLKLPADTLLAATIDSFDAAVHHVTSQWKEAEVTWGEKDFPVTFNPMPLDKQKIIAKAPVANVVSFNLSPEVVASWFSAKGAQRDSNGILIQASSASFIKEFHSRFSLVNKPFLEVITNRAGKRDTTVHHATASVFVFRRAAPLPGDRIYAGSGEQHLSSLFFNLSLFRPDTIPRNATINRALLTLDIDADNSLFVDTDYTLSLALYRTQKKYGLDTLKTTADSLFLVQREIIARASNASIQFEVTSLVQFWTLAPPTDYGYFVVYPNFLQSSLVRLAFFRRADAARAPRLRIEYTTPPQ